MARCGLRVEAAEEPRHGVGYGVREEGGRGGVRIGLARHGWRRGSGADGEGVAAVDRRTGGFAVVRILLCMLVAMSLCCRR